jgi:transposase
VTYSIDLRQKVLVALESEPSSEVLAEQLGVSGSFVRKLRARVRLTGNPAPLSPPGKTRIVDPQGQEVLHALVAKRPDATLDMLVRLFPRHGGRKVSDTTIWRTLCRMGMSLRKTVFATGRDRPDVVAARIRFRKTQKTWDPSRLIFVDESGVNLSMTRSVAWAPVGQRGLDTVPGNRWSSYAEMGRTMPRPGAASR